MFLNNAWAQTDDASLMTTLQTLNEMTGGYSGGLFSWPNLIGGLIFGGVGLVAFLYGKKGKNYKPLVIGIALMAYPYFITNTFWLYAVGLGLCGLLYYWRD